MKVSVHRPWDPLKICVISQMPSSDVLSLIPDARARDQFHQICAETRQDLEDLKRLLQSFNVEVLQPNYCDGLEIPVAPRGDLLVIGQNLVMSHQADARYRCIIDQIDPGHLVSPGCQSMNGYFCKVIGPDLIMGVLDEIKTDAEVLRDCKEFVSDYCIHLQRTNGFGDGTHAVIAPGVIVSRYSAQIYQEIYAGWTVLGFPDSDPWPQGHWPMMQEWIRLRDTVPRSTRLTDWHRDPCVWHLIDQWTDRWQHVDDRVYLDTNVLMIDQHNLVCFNHPLLVSEDLESLGIKTHVVRFRHRHFWDGGAHVHTADLLRAGERLDFCLQRRN